MKMKLRPHGAGRLVPDSRHWLIPRDEDWHRAEENAIAALRSLDLLPEDPDFDLVWSLLEVESLSYIPNLEGASGGAAMALAGAILLGKDDPWISMRKQGGYAVTAQIGKDDTLGTVDDVPIKLVGAARNSSLPLITTVGLCPEDWEQLREKNENYNWPGLEPKGGDDRFLREPILEFSKLMSLCVCCRIICNGISSIASGLSLRRMASEKIDAGPSGT